MNNLALYNAQISAGSLLLKESREVANILLKDPDGKLWYQAICVDNILQKKSRATAKRMARLIRNRLESMPREYLKIVANESAEVAAQILLGASIKHSRLLADFIKKVVKDHLRTFNYQLSLRDWESFLNECEQIDTSVNNWSESTRKKIGQVVFRILAEAKYIDSTRSMKILPVQIFPEVRQYLKETKQTNILEIMEISR